MRHECEVLEMIARCTAIGRGVETNVSNRHECKEQHRAL